MKTKNLFNGSQEELLKKKLASMKLIARAINHPLRLKILEAIDDKKRKTTHERNCVTDIYTAIRVEQSVASQHLAILREANILEDDRVGKFVFYEINYELVDLINQIPLAEIKEKTKK